MRAGWDGMIWNDLHCVAFVFMVLRSWSCRLWNMMQHLELFLLLLFSYSCVFLSVCLSVSLPPQVYSGYIALSFKTKRSNARSQMLMVRCWLLYCNARRLLHKSELFEDFVVPETQTPAPFVSRHFTLTPQTPASFPPSIHIVQDISSRRWPATNVSRARVHSGHAAASSQYVV
jgi:hypothetical protein